MYAEHGSCDQAARGSSILRQAGRPWMRIARVEGRVKKLLRQGQLPAEWHVPSAVSGV